MAFAHQYTHAGTASMPGSQVILSTKSSHSPTAPSTMEQARALLHESGLPLLHFLPRMNGLPESLYGQGPLTPNGLGVEPSAFYPMGSPPGHLTGSPEWKGIPGQSPVVYPFDPMLACHPYASFYGGLDLNNAARRKNATRETTSALKAWLYEHRKNPYPTKGEKIMLAIITKMTLTQVSTWFANARRRLKKESKTGWNGKDRDLDDSDFETDGDERTNENEDKSKMSSISCSGNESDDDDIDIKVTSDISDISDTEIELEDSRSIGMGSRISVHSEPSTNSIPSYRCENRLTNSSPATRNECPTINVGQSNSNATNTKPKIWSIEEIMNKDSNKANTSGHHHQTHSRTLDNIATNSTLPERINKRPSSIDSSQNSKHTINGLKSQSNQTGLRARIETVVSPSDSDNDS